MFLPGESQGWGSLVGCRLWGRTESDTTEATWQQQQQFPYLNVANNIVVWYSHLFKNFPQFVVIHTVKGFGVVNKAEVNVILELSLFI